MRYLCANHAVERRVDGSAATFDLCTALVPSAAAPATFDIDLVRARPWQPGHPEQLGLPQKAAAVARTANTHSLIFEVCCAVDLLLLEITKRVPSRASCAVASPPEF